MVGSIGVLSTHLGWSRRNEQQGLGVTYIHAGKYKVEGNADTPLDKESRAEMQRHVDRYYRMFVESVARNTLALSCRVKYTCAGTKWVT